MVHDYSVSQVAGGRVGGHRGNSLDLSWTAAESRFGSPHQRSCSSGGDPLLPTRNRPWSVNQTVLIETLTDDITFVKYASFFALYHPNDLSDRLIQHWEYRDWCTLGNIYILQLNYVSRKYTSMTKTKILKPSNSGCSFEPDFNAAGWLSAARPPPPRTSAGVDLRALILTRSRLGSKWWDRVIKARFCKNILARWLESAVPRQNWGAGCYRWNPFYP